MYAGSRDSNVEYVAIAAAGGRFEEVVVARSWFALGQVEVRRGRREGRQWLSTTPRQDRSDHESSQIYALEHSSAMFHMTGVQAPEQAQAHAHAHANMPAGCGTTLAKWKQLLRSRRSSSSFASNFVFLLRRKQFPPILPTRALSRSKLSHTSKATHPPPTGPSNLHNDAGPQLEGCASGAAMPATSLAARFHPGQEESVREG